MHQTSNLKHQTKHDSNIPCQTVRSVYNNKEQPHYSGVIMLSKLNVIEESFSQKLENDPERVILRVILNPCNIIFSYLNINSIRYKFNNFKACVRYFLSNFYFFYQMMAL